jgi:hypothetical protein
VTSLLSVFVFLHVLSQSFWFGATLWVTGDVRRTLALGRPHVDVLPARLRPALGLDALAAFATIATGVLLYWTQGFPPPRPGLAAGMILALARVGVIAGMRLALRDVLARLHANVPVPADDPAARRVSMLGGMAHLTWLLALAGMTLPI